MLRPPGMNASAGKPARTNARIEHQPISRSSPDAIDFPVHTFLELTVRRVREETEGIENLLLFGAKVLGGEGVCVEAGVLGGIISLTMFLSFFLRMLRYGLF